MSASELDRGDTNQCSVSSALAPKEIQASVPERFAGALSTYERRLGRVVANSSLVCSDIFGHCANPFRHAIGALPPSLIIRCRLPHFQTATKRGHSKSRDVFTR